MLIAGGIGNEKKAPARSPIMGTKNSIEEMIARLEANRTRRKRKPIDNKNRVRPVKIVPIAT